MPAPSPQACSADFTAALIGRDLGAALALLADDVVFFFSTGAEIRGKDAFAATLTASWNAVSEYAYRASPPIWIAEGPAAAAVIYGFAWSGMVGGEKVGGSGRGTRVFRKGPSGWLLAHEHVSGGTFAG